MSEVNLFVLSVLGTGGRMCLRGIVTDVIGEPVMFPSKFRFKVIPKSVIKSLMESGHICFDIDSYIITKEGIDTIGKHKPNNCGIRVSNINAIKKKSNFIQKRNTGYID